VRRFLTLARNALRRDLDLRLAGYEVFRFGASELLDDQADDLVKTFFIALFKRHGMAV